MGERRTSERAEEQLRRAQGRGDSRDQEGVESGRAPDASGNPAPGRPTAEAADAPGAAARTTDPGTAVRGPAGSAATRTPGSGTGSSPTDSGSSITDSGTRIGSDRKARRPAAPDSHDYGKPTGTTPTTGRPTTPTTDRPTTRPGDRTPAAAPTEHLLPERTSEGLEARWRDILVGFVDGPKHSVEEADRLLDEVTGLIADGLKERRRTLRNSWQGEDETRTEELRVALQKYRGLVTHLLRT
ncbi:hypothetical protein [Peterkaempfera sp. SMS 1(5)a]|uniref:hypothetical protein n=1 Tax=Peterkaempfera podocarpi TaxID=3232308 RepID=UPI00366D5A5A